MIKQAFLLGDFHKRWYLNLRLRLDDYFEGSAKPSIAKLQFFSRKYPSPFVKYP